MQTSTTHLTEESTPLDTGDDAGCDREPIHLSGAIQPHGVLLVIRADDYTVLQASQNASTLLAGGAPVLGRPFDTWIEPASLDLLGRLPVEARKLPNYVDNLRVKGHGAWQTMVHRNPSDDTTIVVELQPADGFEASAFHTLPPLLRSSTERLAAAKSMEDAWTFSADEVRRLNGFERVMIYRFEPDWSGQVVGESLGDGVESWMGLRYPASDIPAQARAMYVHNRVRLTADVRYKPVPIEPELNPNTRRPIDLTFAVLRSVSPIHLEYLRNMGVGASMSVSIVRDGVLWGMILCHHRTARPLSFETLVGCELIGEVLALQMPAKELAREAEQLRQARSIHPRLLQRMAAEADFTTGLLDPPEDFLGIAHAAGAALVLRGKIHRVGVTPSDGEIAALAEFVGDTLNQDIFYTDTLPKKYPAAAGFKAVACGLMCATISRIERGYLMWFRPEVFRTLNWAGDPQKPSDFTAAGRVVHPRTNFEVWKQTLREHSEPWRQADIDAVAELRNSVVGIVLRQAEARSKLTAELQQSNKELEAFSYSVSHDLRAPFRHIVGYSDLLQKRNADLDDTSKRYVRTIAESARFAGTLVDGLLSFSQMGRTALRIVPVDLNRLAADVWREVSAEAGGTAASWSAGPLPTVFADPLMLRLVLRNLLSNAIKYSRKAAAPAVEIGMQPYTEGDESTSPDIADADPVTLFIRDNGVGFDPAFKNKLFGVFQRLHRVEDFEGTGIGLANVRRIVERHGGRTWAESQLGHGAVFYFTLPQAMRNEIAPAGAGRGVEKM